MRLRVRVVVLLLPSHRETCRDVSLRGKRTGGPSSPKSSSSRSGKSSASAMSKSSSASTTARTSGAAAIIACASSAPRPRAFGTSAPSLRVRGVRERRGVDSGEARERRVLRGDDGGSTQDAAEAHEAVAAERVAEGSSMDVAATSWTSIERAVTKPTPPRTGKDFDAATFWGGSRRGGGDDDPDAAAGRRLPRSRPPPARHGRGRGGVLMGRSSGRDPHRGAFASRVPRSRPGGARGRRGSAERAMRAIADGARGGDPAGRRAVDRRGRTGIASRALLLVLRGLLRGGFVVGVEHAEGGEADEEPGGDVPPRVVRQGCRRHASAFLKGVVAAGHGRDARDAKWGSVRLQSIRFFSATTEIVVDGGNDKCTANSPSRVWPGFPPPPFCARALSSDPAPLFTMADPAMQELKRNAMILGAWIAAIRIAPYVCHAVQGALSK